MLSAAGQWGTFPVAGGITAKLSIWGTSSLIFKRYMPIAEPDRAPRPANADPLLKTVAQGGATSVWAATSPLLEGVGGKYFSDCNEPSIVATRPKNSFGVAAYALYSDDARKLWHLSETIIPL